MIRAVAAASRGLLLVGVIFGAGLAQATTASADTVNLAVATNFAEPVEALAIEFKARTGHDVKASSGSSGALYAQIVSGAPFDAMLSADNKRPADLERDGAGVAGTRFTYSIGRLALWSADPQRITHGDGKAALSASTYRAIAIAKPELAPYGRAAEQVLRSLGLWEVVQSKLVFGKNIGQTHALVASGNAELGFVALSALRSKRNGKPAAGSAWIIPADLYEPVRQDAILLTTAKNTEAAKAFLDFLRTEDARAIITSFGYATDK